MSHKVCVMTHLATRDFLLNTGCCCYHDDCLFAVGSDYLLEWMKQPVCGLSVGPPGRGVQGSTSCSKTLWHLNRLSRDSNRRPSWNLAWRTLLFSQSRSLSVTRSWRCAVLMCSAKWGLCALKSSSPSSTSLIRSTAWIWPEISMKPKTDDRTKRSRGTWSRF